MPISGLTLEPSLAAFGGIGFLSFRPRPPRLSESDGGQVGRAKGQQKSCQSCLIHFKEDNLEFL